MSKQTALQFFLTGLIDLNIGELLVDDKWIQFKELYQQAKAMEREQIEQSYSDGLGNGCHYERGDAAESVLDEKQYYQRTYGKEASDEEHS